jgi:hypothetical protein
VGKTWYSIVEDDDWSRFNWKAWERTETDALLNPDLTIKDENISIPVEVTLYAYMQVEDKEDVYHSYSTSDKKSFSVSFEPGELDDFYADPINLVKSYQDELETFAVSNYNAYWGLVGDSAKQKDDLRINIYNARLSYASQITTMQLLIDDPMRQTHEAFTTNLTQLGLKGLAQTIEAQKAMNKTKKKKKAVKNYNFGNYTGPNDPEYGTDNCACTECFNG